MDLFDLRREYRLGELRAESLAPSPFTQFERWLQNAVDAEAQDTTAMCLATVDDRGMPSQRIVLLKHLDEHGLVFYTNLESRKAKEIAVNRHVSLNFSWLEIDRQVHVEGVAERLGMAAVLKYFTSRPRDSQLAAWASQQSRQVSGRQILEEEFSRMRRKFLNAEIPLPGFWGGYRIVPRRWEFWQGRENRLHDRFQYTALEDGSWEVFRVSP